MGTSSNGVSFQKRKIFRNLRIECTANSKWRPGIYSDCKRPDRTDLSIVWWHSNGNIYSKSFVKLQLLEYWNEPLLTGAWHNTIVVRLLSTVTNYWPDRSSWTSLPPWFITKKWSRNEGMVAENRPVRHVLAVRSLISHFWKTAT